MKASDYIGGGGGDRARTRERKIRDTEREIHERTERGEKVVGRKQGQKG